MFPSSKIFDAVGFGALNLDKLFRVNRIACQEDEAFVISLHESGGGSAANTIVGLARLGIKTGYVGKVAKDIEGKRLLKELRNEGVDISSIITEKTGHSGIVMCFIDLKGERAMYVLSGVNDTIKFEEIDLEYIKNTKILHLTSFVSETSFKTQKRVVEEVSDNVMISFDPGALYARKGFNELKPILKRTFVFMPNETELSLLTKKDYKEGAKTLIKEGVHLIAVKLGSKGCYVTDGKESHIIERYNVKVVDTTGAGDAFCTGFLYGLLNNKDLYTCGKLGNFIASRCIMKIGARTGLPKLSELPSSL
jgi:ribokinase